MTVNEMLRCIADTISREYRAPLEFLTAYFQQHRTGSGHTRSPALREQQPYERHSVAVQPVASSGGEF